MTVMCLRRNGISLVYEFFKQYAIAVHCGGTLKGFKQIPSVPTVKLNNMFG